MQYFGNWSGLKKAIDTIFVAAQNNDVTDIILPQIIAGEPGSITANDVNKLGLRQAKDYLFLCSYWEKMCPELQEKTIEYTKKIFDGLKHEKPTVISANEEIIIESYPTIDGGEFSFEIQTHCLTNVTEGVPLYYINSPLENNPSSMVAHLTPTCKTINSRNTIWTGRVHREIISESLFSSLLEAFKKYKKIPSMQFVMGRKLCSRCMKKSSPILYQWPTKHIAIHHALKKGMSINKAANLFQETELQIRYLNAIAEKDIAFKQSMNTDKADIVPIPYDIPYLSNMTQKALKNAGFVRMGDLLCLREDTRLIENFGVKSHTATMAFLSPYIEHLSQLDQMKEDPNETLAKSIVRATENEEYPMFVRLYERDKIEYANIKVLQENIFPKPSKKLKRLNPQRELRLSLYTTRTLKKAGIPTKGMFIWFEYKDNPTEFFGITRC